MPINPQDVYEELLIHPDYPSLLAISDILTTFNIENAAYHIEAQELINVPCPFIAQIALNRGEFVVVTDCNAETISVSNDKWDKRKFAYKEFQKMFAGTVLTAEFASSYPKSTKKITSLPYSKSSLAFTGLCFILISSLIFNTNYIDQLNWQILILAIFKSAGLITSVLLLIQSIDSNNPLVKKLCQNGIKTNCNAILSSKAATVFEGLTWSEVGFFYFAGTWLLLLFGDGSLAIWQTLILLNIISLPYTFYSIYYQAHIAKQWCVLCCTIQALLWFEVVPLIASMRFPLSIPTAKEWSILFIALLLPVVLWVLIKPLLQQVQQLHPLKQQLNQSKYNQLMFNSLLTQQPKYIQPDEEWCIVLGNVEANNIITIVTNPYCPPCAKTHKLLHELLEQRPDIQARIIFTADNTDNDIKTPVSRHLMALHSLADETIVIRALYDWYAPKKKNYDAWANLFPTQITEEVYDKMSKQKIWCEIAEITETPTVLLNGYRLSELYELSDLKYILE